MEYFCFFPCAVYTYHRKKQEICLLGTTIVRKELLSILDALAQGAFIKRK
jgi:hypothetical protein